MSWGPGRPSTLRRDILTALQNDGYGLTAVDLAFRLDQKVETVRRSLQRMDHADLKGEMVCGFKVWSIDQ